MMTPCALLLLLFAATSVCQFDMDFVCPTTNHLVPAASVCDGIVDCPNATEDRYKDEIDGGCVPAPYLENGLSLVATEVTGTSIRISWSPVPMLLSNHSLKLRGFFFSGKSSDGWFGDTLGRHLLTHSVQWLKPSTLYTFVLRPYYTATGELEHTYTFGKAASMEVRTLSSDYFEISIEIVNSTAAVVTWSVLMPAEKYQVDLFRDSGGGGYQLDRTLLYDGEKTLWTYSAMISNLEPWTYYVASMKSCSDQGCHDAGNRRFFVPPDHLPLANVTRIESRRPGSFEMDWLYAQDNHPHHGFRVRYCEMGAVTCSLVFTNKTSFTVDGLANDTVYNVDVRAQLKTQNGGVVLGLPGTASIRTWTYAPILTVKHEANFKDQLDVCLLSWASANNSADYLQYRFGEREPWKTCHGSDDCNVTVAHEKTAVHTRGFIRLRYDRPTGKLHVGVRGCNSHGCGKERSVEFASNGPLQESELEVRGANFTARLGVSVPDKKGFQITGLCGDDWEVHFEKSMYERPSQKEYEEIEVQGLPLRAENCLFYVTTYDVRGNMTWYTQPREARRLKTRGG